MNPKNQKALNRSKPGERMVYLHFVLDHDGKQEYYCTKVGGLKKMLDKQGFHASAAFARQAFINGLQLNKITTGIISPHTGSEILN
jgi:hypothetical protein